MVLFVLTAVILFFTILFWNIEKFNRIARHEPCKMPSSESA